eukprot:CAMPEP_0197437630 /NCGR_PEP_ID=MMETSP1175-20131217/4837_1 /TAXON_ID=1003142 /ORGANISM="Triceratium dubium, Strain CCMP147" /LENGTH=227 /DNA_ID=CAMNT_0042967207 /DNA_START=34 /DNA_END=717 /DNA_ORIENTATION=+
MSTKESPSNHDPSSMEGMIWNANRVLDRALDPNTRGIPRDIFFECRGIVLLSSVEAGFIFSATGGTGVIIAKDKDDKWGPPSAIGTGGIGFGALFGIEMKEIMIILLTDGAVKAFAGDKQVKLGGEVGVAVGPLGREIESSLQASGKGATASLSYTFSDGFFGGAGIEGAVFKGRTGANEKFYGTKLTPAEILLEGKVTVPEGKGIEDLHEKLEMLAQGETSEKDTD